jgi:hypothetical protein
VQNRPGSARRPAGRVRTGVQASCKTDREFKKDSRTGQEYRPAAKQNREFNKDSRTGQE